MSKYPILTACLALLLLSAFVTLDVTSKEIYSYWNIGEAITPWIVLWAILVVFFMLARSMLSEKSRALPLTVYQGFLLFKFDNFIQNMQVNEALLLWIMLAIMGGYIIIAYRGPARIILSVLICVIALFGATSAFKIVKFYVSQRYDLAALPPQSDFLTKTAQNHAAQLKPDIYYIVLDAYAGNDTLKRLFNYDNAPFIDQLKKDDFYIADQSHSQYMQTMLSVSSTLNMNYLQNDLMLPHDRFADRNPLVQRFLHPRLFHYLQQDGYDLKVYTMAYNIDTTPEQNITDIRADNFMLRIWVQMVNRTPFYPILTYIFGPYRSYLNPHLNYFNTQKQKLASLKQEAATAGMGKPKLVYAHLLLPHPPFVYDAKGNFVKTTALVPFSYVDGDLNAYWNLYPLGWRLYYARAYLNQLKFTNSQMQEIVSEIQTQAAKSKRPVIIFIQSDHGSRSHVNFATASTSDYGEVFSNFNVVWYSDKNYSGLSRNITPLNLLRHTMDKYFGFNLPMLEDRQYYSSWLKPYRFIDMTKHTHEPHVTKEQ